MSSSRENKETTGSSVNDVELPTWCSYKRYRGVSDQRKYLRRMQSKMGNQEKIMTYTIVSIVHYNVTEVMSVTVSAYKRCSFDCCSFPQILVGCITTYMQLSPPLTLWIRIPLMRGVFDTTLCDKVCPWLAAGQWFSPGPPVSSTNKSDCHDITEILLKVIIN
jgi:hypothetical protein